MAAALTFIVILLGLGIPVWWNTTAVKRASLPLDQLSIMTPISASDHSFPLTFKSLRDSEKLLEHLTKIKAASKELGVLNTFVCNFNNMITFCFLLF